MRYPRDMPVYILDKPLGLSSHDVVARARKRLQTRRVGHAGTLDPLATGVLLLLSEEATKLSPFLSASNKHYLAWVSFGASTATLDAEGPVLEHGDASSLSAEAVAAALPAFLHCSLQHPPQYSAIKQGGVKGYQAARRGETLDLPARPAGYTQVHLLEFAAHRDALVTDLAVRSQGRVPYDVALPPVLGDFPTALIALEVQAGTYIRAFARDLGEALGVPAHLSGLVRNQAGRASLERAITLEALEPASQHDPLGLLPYPQRQLSDEEAQRVRQGQRLAMQLEQRSALIDPAGQLVAIAESLEGRFSLLRVWHKPL